MRRINHLHSLALALLASQLLLGCRALIPTPPPASHPTLPPARYQTSLQRDLLYGPLGTDRLDLCLPQHASGLRPGVVLIHGGGWRAGDKTNYSEVCAYLASQGFVAATINYRLTPINTWPAPLVDVQLAVRWLRAHASDYALDPTRICSYGASAGGHLAVFLGVLPTIHPGDAAALLADQSPAVRCVVDEFGPVDLTQLTATPGQQSILTDLFGGATSASDPAIYRDASPLLLVSSQSAPTLIIQGTQDTLVPPAQSLALQSALERAHVDAQYISYPGGHSYSGLLQPDLLRIDTQILTFLLAQTGA